MSAGGGYDLSATTFSPDGRIFQIEYAAKSVDARGTALGMRCKDGVVLAVEKLVASKMLEEGSNRHIFTVDRSAGMAIAGLQPDARQVVERARSEAESYKSTYGEVMPAHALNERVAQWTQLHTMYGAVRPFGCAVLLGSYDRDGPRLFSIEPSGRSFGYFACAIGKASNLAKTELEKLSLSDMSCVEAICHAARIILLCHDENKDKDFVLEASWVCDDSQRRHHFVPKNILDSAIEQAKQDIKDAQ